MSPSSLHPTSSESSELLSPRSGQEANRSGYPSDDVAPVARELPARDYGRITSGTRDLLAANGNARRAAERTRVRQPQLDKYASDDRLTEFMPADVIADLESACGKPILTRILAELSGYDLVRLPEFDRGLGDIDALLLAAKETTEAVAAGWSARADGKVTRAELADVRRQVNEAIASLLSTLAAFERSAE